jgi:phosphoribosylformimino-5-aminoimidazole carboxamide ribonucleotide (ProFAR) isomerase
MPVGFGRVKSKGRPLSVMAHLKRSVIEGKAETNCLAHALIIATARITNDPDYNSYRNGRRILPVVKHLLETTGIDLQHGGGINEVQQFQDHFTGYRIVVFGGLDCEDVIFDG